MKLEDFTAERYPVRKAIPADIPVLANVAAVNRNNFDRLHADYSFSEQDADHYLATYAQAAVNGFCATVLVPNVPTLRWPLLLRLTTMKRFLHNIG
jgi:dTDP-4-amino-4,6-dideoxy-D-galactose acyltransferase